MDFFSKHENMLAYMLIGLALAFSLGLALWSRIIFWTRVFYSPLLITGVCSCLGLAAGAAFGSWLDAYAQARYEGEIYDTQSD